MVKIVCIILEIKRLLAGTCETLLKEHHTNPQSERRKEDKLDLQWTTVGSTTPVRHCRTLTTKSRKSELSSGTPWSGHAMYCICRTIRSSLPADCIQTTHND